jgi:hypothetical protein
MAVGRARSRLLARRLCRGPKLRCSPTQERCTGHLGARSLGAGRVSGTACRQSMVRLLGIQGGAPPLGSARSRHFEREGVMPADIRARFPASCALAVCPCFRTGSRRFLGFCRAHGLVSGEMRETAKDWGRSERSERTQSKASLQRQRAPAGRDLTSGLANPDRSTKHAPADAFWTMLERLMMRHRCPF